VAAGTCTGNAEQAGGRAGGARSAKRGRQGTQPDHRRPRFALRPPAHPIRRT